MEPDAAVILRLVVLPLVIPPLGVAPVGAAGGLEDGTGVGGGPTSKGSLKGTWPKMEALSSSVPMTGKGNPKAVTGRESPT